MCDQNNKIQVILLGPGSSTPGGVSSVVDLQMRSKYLKDHVKTVFLRTTGQRPSTEWGKVTFANISYFWIAMCRLAKILLTFRQARICHIHASYGVSFYKNFLFASLATIFGKATILHIHGSKISSTLGRPNWIAKKINGFVLRQYDSIIVLNEEVRALVKAYDCDKHSVHLVPNAVSLPESNDESNVLSRVKELKALGNLICLTVGVVGKRKGVFDLIQVAQMLKERSQRVLFVVVGGWIDDEEQEKAMQEIREKAIEDVIIFTGELPRESVVGFYREADIYVLLSHAEGMPISILEAMSTCCPIVTTPVGGIPQQVKNMENGLLVPIGNSQEATAAIMTLYQDSELRGSMGNRNVAKVEAAFGIERYGQNVYSVYQKTLDRKFGRKIQS